MDAMWAGYIWGEHTSWTMQWEPPRKVFAEASLHLLEAPRDRRLSAVAWVRSVTVRDPSTGLTLEVSSSTVPLRIESNAVAVTYGLNTTAGVEAEWLMNVFWWPNH